MDDLLVETWNTAVSMKNNHELRGTTMYGRNDVSGSAHKNDITIFLSRYKISKITFHLFFHIVLASLGPLANSPSDSLRLVPDSS